MGLHYLTWLADEFRAGGLTVAEYPGWRVRARGSGGYSDPKGPLCVMWHHTASPRDAAAVADYEAENAVTAPICNVDIAWDGTVHLLAAGQTNTNGKGLTKRFSRGTVPNDAMNSYAFGMEISNNGIGQRYPQAQIDAAFKVSNIVNARCGNQPTDVMEHASYSPGRKIDPAKAIAVEGPWDPHGYSTANTWVLDDLIAECARRALYQPPQPKPPQPQPIPPTPEDEVSTVVVLEDVRNGTWYRCGLESKSWVQDGDMAAQLIARIDETTANGVAIDGVRYVKMKNGNRNYIRSTGPIVGPMPPNVDLFGG